MKLYYFLTGYLPRRLPSTKDELDALRCTLQLYYGLGDSLDEWICVLGHLQATPARSLRNSYINLVNPAKRLRVNKLAQDEKMLAIGANQKILEEKLKAKLEQVASELPSNEEAEESPRGIPRENLPGGALPVEGDLSRLQAP